jgi:hypothetical protein
MLALVDLPEQHATSVERLWQRGCPDTPAEPPEPFEITGMLFPTMAMGHHTRDGEPPLARPTLRSEKPGKNSWDLPPIVSEARAFQSRKHTTPTTKRGPENRG